MKKKTFYEKKFQKKWLSSIFFNYNNYFMKQPLSKKNGKWKPNHDKCKNPTDIEFLDEIVKEVDTNFSRNDSLRKTFRRKEHINTALKEDSPNNNSLENQMPKPVLKAMEKYKERYINFKSGGIFQNGKEMSTSATNQTQPRPEIATPTTTTLVRKDQQIMPELTIAEDNVGLFDPVFPPITKLGLISASGDSRYLIGRLRDDKILDLVKLYITQHKELSRGTSFKGMTATDIMIQLGKEGLPTCPDKLKIILRNFYEAYNCTAEHMESGLEAYRKYITSLRINHLNTSKNNFNQFLNFQMI